MDTRPKEKSLRTVSFVAHATRGVIRDKHVRRKAMFVLLMIAVLMAVAGSTFLQEALNPREHLGWFLVFWLACAWLTITTLLLAIFDLLIVRAEARAARRILRDQVSPPERPD